MTPEHDLQHELQAWLDEGPTSAPPVSRAVVRGRMRETPQRPAWLVRDRGAPFDRPRRAGIRLLAIGLALLALGALTTAMLSVGTRPAPPPRASPEITTFPVRGQPLGIAYESGAVWAGMFDVGRVTRVDPETGATTDIDSFGRNCVGMSAGAGAVWVPTCQAGPLKRIDPRANTAEVVQLDGRRQVGAPIPFDGDVGWFTIDVDQGVYVRYDGRGRQELSRGRIEPSGSIVAAGFDSAWAVRGAGTAAVPDVVRLDAETLEEIARVETELPPVAGLPLGDSLWLATGVEGTDRGVLLRIDPSTNRVVAKIEFDFWELRLALLGSELWVLDGTDPARLFRIDPGVNRVVERITVGGEATGLAGGDDALWLTRLEGRDVVRVRPPR